MRIETRVSNLEKLVNNLIKNMNNDKFYTNADINGVRKGVSDITPYTETKKAYYHEEKKNFYNVPDGNLSVFFDNYNDSYSVTRIENRLTVEFEPLEKETNITISIQ